MYDFWIDLYGHSKPNAILMRYTVHPSIYLSLGTTTPRPKLALSSSLT